MLRWLGWEVIFPLLLPPLATLVVVLMSMTGPNPVDLKMEMLDFAPWTLCFFALTLVGSTLRRSKRRYPARQGVYGSLLVIASFIAIYAALIVIWRQGGTWRPDISVWVTSSVLALIAVSLCYELEHA